MRNKLYIGLAVIGVVVLASLGGLAFLRHAEFPPQDTSVKEAPKNEEAKIARSAVKVDDKEASASSDASPAAEAKPERSISREEARKTARQRTLDRLAKLSAAEDETEEYDASKDRVKDELLVLDPPQGFEDRVASLGFVVLDSRELNGLGIQMLRVRKPPASSAEIALNDLQAEFPGLAVDFNHIFEPSQDQRRRRSGDATTNKRPTTRREVTSRARAQIGWDDLPLSCGTGVKIGMIDSGVDMQHPALQRQDITVRNMFSRHLRPGNKSHGTAVAALLVGKPDKNGFGGLLPAASLKVANIFGVNKQGRVVGTAGAILRGVNWLVEEKVHAVNIGVTGANNKHVRRAMTIAQKNDMVMVAATGNRNYKKKRAYPAAYFNTLAVTAVGPYQGIMRNANRGSYIDFAAPGVRLWTAAPGGAGKHRSGTSFATTYVTAVLASHVAQGSSRDPDRLREILRRGVRDLGEPGKDDLYGWGYITRKPFC